MVPVPICQEQFLQGEGPWNVSDILKIPSAQALVAVLGEKHLQHAFDEYAGLRPSTESIPAKDYTSRIFAMTGEREPNPTDLYRWVRDPPTDEPWAEALFVYRVIRRLESPHCSALDWKPVDYWTLPTVEDQRRSRGVLLERYEFVLQILERFQDDRYKKALASVEQKIRAEVDLIDRGAPVGNSSHLNP